MDQSIRLEGPAWERWANQLLQMHYGPGGYQKIPDTDKGDAGLEGFSIGDRRAYQMYGPEGPLSPDDEYRRLRTKITADTRKFMENRSTLEKLLAGIQIERWVLLVPSYRSKKIVEHAAKRTSDIKGQNLPYVDNSSFRVVVEDEGAFAHARNLLLRTRVGEIRIDPPVLSSKDIDRWQAQNNTLTQRLTAKLSRLPTLRSEAQQSDFKDKILHHFLEGQNALEELRQYPTAYEAAIRAKSHRERYLATEVALTTKPGNELLIECLHQIRNAVRTEHASISEDTLEHLAWEAVSDWLLRCPLDFPPT